MVGWWGGVEEWTLRLNSAQFQLKLPAGAKLGKKGKRAFGPFFGIEKREFSPFLGIL